MANPSAGPGRPVTDEQRVRYMPAINTSSYDAPPFAAMRRDCGTASGSIDDKAYGGDIVDGVFVWHVGRPDAACEARQLPADIVFNGPEVMRAGKPGRVTEDFPAKALHMKSDTLHRKDQTLYAGPKADSWLLWDSGNAFRWLGRDSNFQHEAFEAGFVTAVKQIPFSAGSGGTDASYLDVEPDQTIELDDTSASVSHWNDLSVIPYSNPVLGRIGYGVQVERSALYDVAFHCSLFSQTAPRDAVLQLMAMIEGPSPTGNGAGFRELFRLMRTQQIEIDNYGNEISTGIENVAGSCLARIYAGQVITVQNSSNYQVTVLSAKLTVVERSPWLDRDGILVALNGEGPI